jgi:hypothetical protein
MNKAQIQLQIRYLNIFKQFGVLRIFESIGYATKILNRHPVVRVIVARPKKKLAITIL